VQLSYNEKNIKAETIIIIIIIIIIINLFLRGGLHSPRDGFLEGPLKNESLKYTLNA